MNTRNRYSKFGTIPVLWTILFAFLTNLHSVLADQLDSSITNFSVTSSWLQDHPQARGDTYERGDGAQYEATFLHADRTIVGRQAQSSDPKDIRNNEPLNYQIQGGSTLYYSFRAWPTPPPQVRTKDEDFYEHDILRRNDESIEELPSAEESSLGGATSMKPVGRQAPPPAPAPRRRVWVTINTCFLPAFQQPQDQATPPQLSIYHLTEQTPGQIGWLQENLSEGYASFDVMTNDSVHIQLTAPPSDIDPKGVQAWGFDLVASYDAPYHVYNDTTEVSLKLIDSDSHAALLITDGLSNWTAAQTNSSLAHLDYGPPLNIFANNINYTGLNGLRKSYCALYENKKSQIWGDVHQSPDANNGVEMGLTRAFPSNILEEQFYLPGLNRSSMYLGQLATSLNENYRETKPGGGGVLYPPMNFTTKHDENCAVIYNLTFCPQVNYAVPANPARNSTRNLAALYDNTTAKLYQNFSYSLQQIPCNTTPSSQYSLAVTCADCDKAYKTWLCAVTIPKCMDFSSNYNASFLNWDGAPSAVPLGISSTATGSGALASGVGPTATTAYSSSSAFHNDLPSASPLPANINTNYLMPRNLAQKPLPNASLPPITDHVQHDLQMNWIATNSSRNNDTIAALVQPGPYMEVLPCADLCYDLVRMCPAALQFSCPDPGGWLESVNYGKRGVGKDGAYTCNAPGAVYYPNRGRRLRIGVGWIVVLVVMVAMSLT